MRYYEIDSNGRPLASYARPQPGKKLQHLPEQTDENHRWDGEQWVEEITVSVWYQRIADRRYEHEVAGTTFTHSDGKTYGIATDRQSQALTTGAAVQARRAQEAGNTDWSKRWKTAQGFVTMTADDILAMGDAVDGHVQACFDREAELVAKVADGSITEDEIEKGWP